jgi:organic hydroperoxide reductase OsmC/OhrA
MMDRANAATSSPALHCYTAHCAWSGSTGEGYEKYSRAHQGSAAPAAASLALSSDPAFRGDPARLNPEQLLVLAAASCQLLSFLAVAARSRLNVISYEDDATAEMSEADKPIRIGTIRLQPRIVLTGASGDAADDARVRRLVELAHRECYIANSLRTEVTVEPTIEWA